MENSICLYKLCLCFRSFQKSLLRTSKWCDCIPLSGTTSIVSQCYQKHTWICRCPTVSILLRSKVSSKKNIIILTIFYNLFYFTSSRNHLTTLPREICLLPLEVLLVSNNRLVSLPDELGRMSQLSELDASCNFLAHLPVRIGELRKLRVLNLRSNALVYLPLGEIDRSIRKTVNLKYFYYKTYKIYAERGFDHNTLHKRIWYSFSYLTSIYLYNYVLI